MKEKLKELFAPCQPELAELKAQLAKDIFSDWLLNQSEKCLRLRNGNYDNELFVKYGHQAEIIHKLVVELIQDKSE